MANLQAILKWKPEKFKNDWQNADQNRSKNKILLRYVTKNNWELVKHINIKIPWTWKYTLEDFPHIIPTLKFNKEGKVVVEPLDTDGAIVKYVNQGYRPIALNFANARTPGGGYLKGSIAQEEELCRQYPHLYTSLRSSTHNRNGSLYPIKPTEVLITHMISRYRESMTNGYAVINQPNVRAGFITAAAPNMRLGKNKNKSFNNFKDEIRSTLDLIFTVPQFNNREGYNVLVVGAWGCGAFAPASRGADKKKRNEYIRQMANTMAEYVNNYRYLYDIISISIPDENSENYNIFKQFFYNLL